MLMDNGIDKQVVCLDQAAKGLKIPPMVWHEMHDFSKDCVLLVLASEYYDESDYIRDYEQFLMTNYADIFVAAKNLYDSILLSGILLSAVYMIL